jgi:hypothetical protein
MAKTPSKGELKVSPASTVNRQKVVTEPTNISNGRKAKSDVKMIPTERPKRACVCKIAGLQGNLAALFFEKAPNEDAFHQPLKMAMEAQALASDGFILLTNRRVSSSTNDTIPNANTSYPRKIYVINLDENTSSARRIAMEAACRVMNSPQNNRHNIPYIIDETSDVTEVDLPKVDEWVLDKHVVLTNFKNHICPVCVK